MVKDLLRRIDVSKATGIGGIPAKIMKLSANSLALPLTQLFNASLRNATFPEQWKTARVIPVYKKGNPDDPSNYRPISILPIASKIFEKIVLTQVTTYLIVNNKMYDYQAGFRANHSTTTITICLIERIIDNTHKVMITGILFLDLTIAFDSLDHPTLLRKLEEVGCSPDVIAWIKSYLISRTQVVHNHDSEPQPTAKGVPQGTFLGPQLFNTNANDMNTAVEDDCTVYQFANDSAAETADKDPDVVVSRLD